MAKPFIPKYIAPSLIALNAPRKGTRMRATLGATRIVGTLAEAWVSQRVIELCPEGTARPTTNRIPCWLDNGWTFEILDPDEDGGAGLDVAVGLRVDAKTDGTVDVRNPGGLTGTGAGRVLRAVANQLDPWYDAADLSILPEVVNFPLTVAA
ncbi:hypothetical protein QN354_09440 [Cryobacterium sp. 5I3]|uniref:hypothetical protein n=1 Tax=Cryobacterium sp. 5I3 TaxID=3048592 RepID=UPI002B226992|nr:hypothetical protein [Cryobacterium sp. 5I3]MEB0201978.1 hypothetical protein [Cryobacterium sp. 5I3]